MVETERTVEETGEYETLVNGWCVWIIKLF